jgi:hypothetical protein
MCRIESKQLTKAESRNAASRADLATRNLTAAYERFLGQALSRRLKKSVTISFTEPQRAALRTELDRCARLNVE